MPSLDFLLSTVGAQYSLSTEVCMGAYQVVARNFSKAHENKIHDDEIARKYGF